MVRVEVVPCLQDNYAYLIDFGDALVAVDPSEAAPVQRALGDRVLSAIWCTHHHGDHVGGVSALARPGMPVLGSAYDMQHQRIDGQTRGLADNEDAGHGFHVIEVPGHTLGAITYVGHGMAFTGDTLFLGGCGRVFEGTYPMMHASLRRLAALPPETRLYVGHEYTEANLRFGATVEPRSAAIARRLAQVRAPSVPGTLAEELATNVFLRCASDDDFIRVREAKNRF